MSKLNKQLETSETHPIQVDFLSSEMLKAPGRLGLAAIAPGRYGSGAAIYWRRNLAQDLQRLKQDYDTDILVPLIEKHELQEAKISNLIELAEACAIQVDWFPIRDLSVPDSIHDFVVLIDRLLHATQQGKTVVAHCRGGLGRTGLLACCCLIRLGSTPDSAMAAVRKVRPGAVETDIQKSYLNRFSSTDFDSPVAPVAKLAVR